MAYIYLNGSIVDEKDALISVKDRGFRFGDGVYETIAVHGGCPYQWDIHIRRLQSSLKALHITYDTSNLLSIIDEVISKNGITDGLAKTVISRGIGTHGYAPQKAEPTVMVEAIPMPAFPEPPVKLWLSTAEKPTKESLPVHAKTLNGLSSALARMEAQEHDCFEALLLSRDGEICETTAGNIFWIRDKVVYTPSLDIGILGGTTRNAILRLSPYPVREGRYTLKDLKEADEVFLSNVVWKILPISTLLPDAMQWQSHNLTEEIHALLKKDIKSCVENAGAAVA